MRRPGRAAEHAGWLRGQVTAELARPERERSMIGLIAAEMLKKAGWWL